MGCMPFLPPNIEAGPSDIVIDTLNVWQETAFPEFDAETE